MLLVRGAVGRRRVGRLALGRTGPDEGEGEQGEDYFQIPKEVKSDTLVAKVKKLVAKKKAEKKGKGKR